VPFASGSTHTISGCAAKQNSGAGNETQYAPATTPVPLSERTESQSASNSTLDEDVRQKTTTKTMSAPDAAMQDTELSRAISDRRTAPQTPLKADGWQRAFEELDLNTVYPTIISGIKDGFSFGFPTIYTTYTPINSNSLRNNQEAFTALAKNELRAGRWIGPISHDLVIKELGPYQTSPISIITSSSNPEKKRVIQDFSHPRTPRDGITSINSAIDDSAFACTWGTAAVVEALICSLPPGSEIAIRDVSEAFRSIPAHPLQWPAAVIRLSETLRYIDVCGVFGAKPMPGVHGTVTDGACDIFRGKGLAAVASGSANSIHTTWMGPVNECPITHGLAIDTKHFHVR
jgi:hypothetical protein